MEPFSQEYLCSEEYSLRTIASDHDLFKDQDSYHLAQCLACSHIYWLDQNEVGKKDLFSTLVPLVIFDVTERP